MGTPVEGLGGSAAASKSNPQYEAFKDTLGTGLIVNFSAKEYDRSPSAKSGPEGALFLAGKITDRVLRAKAFGEIVDALCKSAPSANSDAEILVLEWLFSGAIRAVKEADLSDSLRDPLLTKMKNANGSAKFSRFHEKGVAYAPSIPTGNYEDLVLAERFIYFKLVGDTHQALEMARDVESPVISSQLLVAFARSAPAANNPLAVEGYFIEAWNVAMNANNPEDAAIGVNNMMLKHPTLDTGTKIKLSVRFASEASRKDANIAWALFGEVIHFAQTIDRADLPRYSAAINSTTDGIESSALNSDSKTRLLSSGLRELL